MAERILICGSRSWGDEEYDSVRMHAEIEALPADATVIHGGAVGADLMAAGRAQARGLTVEEWPADWEKHGKMAGAIRNVAMLDSKPTKVLAFWDGESSGTRHTINGALRRRIPVVVIGRHGYRDPEEEAA